MKIHKPNCMANVTCAVFHADGVCPGPYGKCTCDGNETNVSVPMPPNTKKCDCLHSHLACQYNNPPCHTPAVEDWIKDFDKEFGEHHCVYNGDYKSFIRSLRESDRKRIIEWAEKNQSEDVIWFSSFKHFITNLK